MSIVFVMIPLALMLLVVALGAFLWAVRNRQFDDLDSPATRILFDDDEEGPV
jgi:cbb3-type cytochrome oxidase maturation protein